MSKRFWAKYGRQRKEKKDERQTPLVFDYRSPLHKQCDEALQAAVEMQIESWLDPDREHANDPAYAGAMRYSVTVSTSALPFKASEFFAVKELATKFNRELIRHHVNIVRTVFPHIAESLDGIVYYKLEVYVK